MEARDRLANLGLLVAAAAAWLLVAAVITSRDPLADPSAGPVGAAAIGLAMGLTAVPLFWLVRFGRHRRIAYQGDWVRAARRGAWVAGLVAVFILLQIEGVFQVPIGLFLVVMAVIAESTLSSSR
jgi:hypothetical protein